MKRLDSVDEGREKRIPSVAFASDVHSEAKAAARVGKDPSMQSAFTSAQPTQYSALTRAPSDVSRASKVHPSAAAKGPGAWIDPRVFRAEESRRAEINRMISEDKRIFMSHCWRKTKKLGDGDDLQMKKRQMISHLSKPVSESGPGVSYWADFLDLQAEGPVPWRREIDEAITMCSKVVCFVDEAWLSSFNCLQELAFAIREEKPVVVLVLDQESWELLTVPGGSRKAWNMNEWGVELREYDGQEIVPGQPFNQETLDALFSYLAGINLCACRKLEEQNFGGMPGLLDNMRKYVQKDLLYFKQHAELKEYARKWKQADFRGSLLLHRAEALKWEQWVEAADTMGAMPPPTELQRKFVKSSTSAAKSVIFRLRLAAVLFLTLIVCGAVASGIMASVAMQQRSKAIESEARAEEARRQAESDQAIAEDAKLRAQEARAAAELAEKEAIRDKNKAQVANKVSSSALISSVLGDRIEDPIMQATELRMYKEAAVLLDGAGRDQLDDQLKRRMQRRLGKPVWLALEPLVNHLDELTCAAWSPVDPNLLATGSHDGNVMVWNIATRDVTVLSTHSSSVLALEWSPVSSSRLASGGHDSTVVIWDLSREGEDRILLKEQGHLGPVTALAWSASNTGKLASGGEDNSILIWTLGTASFRVLVGHQAPVTSLSWRPGDETLLASASEDGTVRLWDLSQVSSAEILVHNSSVTAVSYSSSGATVATGQADGSVVVWKVGNPGEESSSVEHRLLGHRDQVTYVVWDSHSHETGMEMAQAGMETGSERHESHADNRLASISSDGIVIGWHLPHGDGPEKLETYEKTSVMPVDEGDSSPVGNTFIVGGVKWADHNSSHLSEAYVVRTSGTHEVHVWRLVQGMLDSVSVNVPYTATGVVLGASTWERAECPGANIAVATENGGIDVMDFEIGSRTANFQGSTAENAETLDWAPHACGVLLVALSDGSLQMWEPALSGIRGITPWRTLVSDATQIQNAVWDHSTPGMLAFTDWDGTIGRIMLLNTAAPGDPAPFALKDGILDLPASLVWSPLPGGRLAAAIGSDILVFDSSRGEISLTDHNLNVESLAWSPVDVDILASGAYDNKVLIWNATTGTKVRELLGHKGTVTSLSWSCDGLYLASASKLEADVRLWDSRTWLFRILEPGPSQEAIASLSFAPHQSLLVAGDRYQGLLRIWRHVDRGVAEWAEALQELHISDASLMPGDMQLWGLQEALDALNE